MGFLFPLCYLVFGWGFFPFSSKPCQSIFFLTCNPQEMSSPSSGDLLLAAVVAAFDPASGNHHEGGSVARSLGLGQVHQGVSPGLFLAL